MEIRDGRRAKSLFMERFGDKEDEPEPQSGPTSPAFRVEDVPLKLTDQRFAAEETRLQRLDLLESGRRSGSSGMQTTMETAPESSVAAGPQLRPGAWQEQRLAQESSAAARETREAAATQSAGTAQAATPRDPRAGMISHSHQKLHRSLLDADLHATYSNDPRERSQPVPSASTFAPRPASGLRATVMLLSLLLVAVIGYGYLAMRQNNISPRQLPGAQAVLNANRGSVGAGLRRAGSALEAVGDRASNFVANTATRIGNWRRSR